MFAEASQGGGERCLEHQSLICESLTRNPMCLIRLQTSLGASTQINFLKMNFMIPQLSII